MGKVVATETFFVASKKGGLQAVQEGSSLDEKDPIVRNNPAKFLPAEEWLDGQSRVFTYVEATTAAPGEKRAVKKPAKKKVVKDAGNAA